MITRSRSCSSTEDSESVTSSQQSDSVLSRKSSVASSYFDSQDSLERREIREISSKKKKQSTSSSRVGSKPVDHECHQKVMIAPDSLLQPSKDNTSTAQLLSIPHPTDESSSRLYLLSANRSTLCEVSKCSDDPRSWFIGDTVQTDGSLLICTPVDRLFLVLPLIVKSDKYTTIDIFLNFDSNCHARLITDLIPNDQWENICDIKVLDNNAITVYRYNNVRTMNWLKKKVDALASHLKDDGTYVGSGSHISGFIQSKKDTQIPEEEYFHYASGMIGDYLPADISDSLLALYPSMINKRKLTQDSSDENSMKPSLKRARCPENGFEPTEDYSKPLSNPKPKPKSSSKLSAGLKALAKVDKKGMKSLTNFFGKK